MTYLTIGDVLKSEADFNNRIAIDAPTGTKIGELVKYTERNKYLIALSDEENGKVLVAPHNCTIWLDNIPETNITKTGLTVEKFIKEGDAFGIKYQGTPIAAPAAPIATPKTDGA